MRTRVLRVIGFTASLVCAVSVCAQTPQFAVVRPDGETLIRTSWDSAYAVAQDDDFIYLPGIVIHGHINVHKRLHIYGTGHHPDSSATMGISKFENSLRFNSGASGSTLQGVIVNSTLWFTGEGKVTEITVIRCKAESIRFYNNYEVVDSLPENIIISECITEGIIGPSTSLRPQNNMFIKNIVTDGVRYLQNSTFSNNIFLKSTTIPTQRPIQSVNTCIFSNNVFREVSPCENLGGTEFFGNSFYNNLKVENNDFSVCGDVQVDNISDPTLEDIFLVDPGSGFHYTDNFMLEPSSAGIGAGTDGTNVGIYGTSDPTPEGWIPSNPHIYFKEIPLTTGPDGKLHIEVGVRAND